MKKYARHHHYPQYDPGPDLSAAALPMIEHIAEQMPGGFFIYRAGEKEELLYANSATIEIFGCATPEEFRALTGFTFSGMIHPEDRAAVQASIREQIAREDNRNIDAVEYRIIRRDGSVRHLADYGRFVHTEIEGDLYYVFVADVTEKYLMEEENRRSAKVIAGLSEAYTSIYLLDMDGGIMIPYRTEIGRIQEIMEDLGKQGEPDWRRVFPEYAKRYVADVDRDRFLQEVQADTVRRRLASGKSWQVDYRYDDPGSGILYMRMSFVVIEGDSLHAIIGFKDISEEVLNVQQATAERMRTEMELEKERRTHEAKSMFLFNVSHDIRTPMNAVLGFTALAKRHMDDPVLLKTYLDRVEESGGHMLSMLDDLLEMGQIDAGGIQLNMERCDLRHELALTVDLLRPMAESKHLSLTLYAEIPDTPVMMDAVRFRRIMANLIGNAVKFTPKNGVITVTARAGDVSASGFVRYEFSVADTGVGMTDEFMARMFRAFEREDTSTRMRQTGTGLGLVIVRSLLNIMGGTISVKSGKGKGSIFTVQLPLRLADHVPAHVAPEEPQEDKRAMGQHRILLVEDIELNRLLAETILEEAGFLVESVPDGCDAVEILREKPAGYYDLVLMDIQMPVMNGYEATRAIRALGRSDLKTLPIVALSANAREEDKQMSLECGMNSHVAKPFDVAGLIRTVNRFIAQRENQEKTS